MQYPALKSTMGDWTYYIVKMKMREVAAVIGFAHEMFDPLEGNDLGERIQRELNMGRVKKQIVQYLAQRDDRLFSSIVVATLHGQPYFQPLQLADNDVNRLHVASGIGDTIGVLTFNQGEFYYALDGQHRLAAIKALVSREANLPQAPVGFEQEEVSVLMVVPPDVNKKTKYRRLFSSLNRYAKPTDRDINIIMDEDDAIAILTRRLIYEHNFFNRNGVVKTKGKNMIASDSFFTTLQTLYEMNETLLRNTERDRRWTQQKDYKQLRPPEDELDGMFSELTVYWNAILSEFGVLNCRPPEMREHYGEVDHLLFWPIGQELFARAVRFIMNRNLPDPNQPTEDSVRCCISVLSELQWDLRKPPWMGLLLIEHPGPADTHRRMRSEDRRRASQVAEEVILYKVMGIGNQDELRVEWHAMLMPQPGRDEADAMWEAISRPIRNDEEG